MKRLLTALSAAACVAGVATIAFAQTTHMKPQTHPNTKVYAYQKTAPTKQATPAANSSSSQLTGSAPYGSPRWWQMMDRATSHGGESQ